MSRCDRVTSEPFRNIRSRVRVIHETAGKGPTAQQGTIVAIRYTGRLPDGTEILGTTRDPMTERWRLGDKVVIAGITEAVTGMKAGGKRTVKIPPDRHWGQRGYGGVIPKNTTLTFDIELISVK